jgi:hypothetical protein
MVLRSDWNVAQAAKKIVSSGMYFIPLLPQKKYNGDTDFLTKDYSEKDIIPEGNLGINPKKSKKIVIDLDSDLAIQFGNLWLPKHTTIGARQYPDGRIERTHWYFENDGSIKTNIKSLPAELYCDHNIVAFGTTIHKQLNVPMKRFWASEESVLPFNESILATFNKINFASMLGKHLDQTNQGGLRLDSCLWRYCKTWTDDDRINFLTDFFKVVRPGSKHNNKKAWERIIKTNNDQSTNNAGYHHFADFMGVDREKVRTWFGWIGETPGKTTTKKTFRNFKTSGIDMLELRKTELAPLQFAIRPILPEGLVLFCGRAKSMKSWKMLLICYSVQNGLKFMGHETVQGDCLYLGLEDSKRRLKSRERKLGVDTLTPPYVDTEAPYLGMGLEESLQEWINAVPNPRLICIDTLARVKANTGRNKAGTAYDHDNETLRAIQKLAIKNGVTIVLVSHLNKAPQDYAFDKITGSTGLQGMVDTMWLLERGEHGAKSTFVGRGRDIADFEYALNWEEETWRYEYVGNLQEVSLNQNRQEVIDAMKEIKKTGVMEIRPRDVVKHCGYPAQSKEAARISKTMLRMVNNYELAKGEKFGTYKLIEINL